MPVILINQEVRTMALSQLSKRSFVLFAAPVYEIVSGEKRITFGADEYANGGWNFFQPEPRRG
jgi:hypothetical protein